MLHQELETEERPEHHTERQAEPVKARPAGRPDQQRGPPPTAKPQILRQRARVRDAESDAEQEEHLLEQGWRLLVAGASARRGHGSMAYVAKDGGSVVELGGREVEPMRREWWSAEG